jgi:hypothetical protein
MATLEYIFCCVCIIGLCVLFAAAVLAGVAVLVTIAINFIKESKEDG